MDVPYQKLYEELTDINENQWNMYEVNQVYETEIIGAWNLWNIESGESFWETNLEIENFLEKHVLVI